MSDSFSIDEIIKMAQNARERANTAKKEANSFAQRDVQDEKFNKTKVITKPVVTEKTVVAPIIKEDFEKTTAVKLNFGDTKKDESLSQKTAVIDDKTRSISPPQRKFGSNEHTYVQKSFFRTEHHSEKVYSDEPPEIIERPATIKSKSKFDKTSDLQEIPTILAVEELQNTRIMGTGDISLEDQQEDLFDQSEGQIKFDGYEYNDGPTEKIDETEAEKNLIARRQEKIKKFRPTIHSELNHKTNEPSIVKSDFRNNDEKTTITERLFSQKSLIQISIIATCVLGVLQLLICVFKDTQYLPSFLLADKTYYITLIVIFVLILIVNINSIIHAFSLKSGINSDLPIVLVAFLTLFHMISLLVYPDFQMLSVGVYTSGVTLALFFSLVGKRTLIVRTIENFEFLTDNSKKYTVETIENNIDATNIGRGLSKENPILKTSIKTDFPTNFLEIGCAREPADSVAGKTGLIMLLINVILFIILYILKGVDVAINTVACSVVMSLPGVALYATNSAVLSISRSLRENGALVNGYEGAQNVNDADGVIIEADELFGPKNCSLHGIKTFNGAKIDDAILKTAAMVIQTKSPLASVFDDVIVGKQSILPVVDKVIYEEKMGASGWIYKMKILVGNRDLLIHHGVSVPKEEYENKYTQKGRKALYLAVAGQIMAMFIVSYKADPTLKKELQKLERSGITLLVRSCDPYVNEKSITEMFSLPEGYVRVMNASSRLAYEKYSDLHVEKSPAYVVHNGTLKGLISALRAAESLIETKTILSVLVSFGSAIGFGVVTLLSFIGGFSQMTPLNVLIFLGVWSIFIIIVTKLKKLNI